MSGPVGWQHLVWPTQIRLLVLFENAVLLLLDCTLIVTSQTVHETVMW
jgi:hypothetical protein